MRKFHLSSWILYPFAVRSHKPEKMKQTFLALLVNLTFNSAEVTHHVHNLVYNTHIQQNLDDCGYYGDRFYFRSRVHRSLL